MVGFGILAMVLVGLGWTFYGYVMGKAPRQNIQVACLMPICSLVTALVCLAIGLARGIPQVEGKVFLLTLVSCCSAGFLNFFQLELMSRAMQKGPNGIIWSIVQSGFVFPFFMGVICFHVPLTLLRLLGVSSLVVSLALVGLCKGGQATGKWQFFALGAFVFTGLLQMLSNLPSYYPKAEAVTSVWRYMASGSGMVLGGVVCGLAGDRHYGSRVLAHVRRWPVWKMVLTLTVPSTFASVFFLYPGMNVLARAGIGSVAYPTMVASSIIGFEIFAVLFLHEKRNTLQILALLLCLAGVAGICL